jgi:hypothetical protein
MKTNSQKSNMKLRLGAFGVALLLLAICPQRAEAQSNTFPSSGNAGVGTPAPPNPLTVARTGSAPYTGRPAYELLQLVDKTDNTPQILFGSAYNGMFLRYTGTDGTATNQRLGIFTGGAAEAFSINNNGQVGIGTTSPAVLLHAALSNTDTGIGNALASFGQVLQNTSTTNNTYVAFGFATKDSASTDLVGSSIVSQFTNHSAGSVTSNLAFFTRNSGSYGERMRIDPAGNVGIGTTSPGTYYTVPAKLDVSSSSHTLMNINGAAGSTASLSFSENGSSKWLIGSRNTYDAPNNRLGFFGGGSEVLTLQSGGNVGIGTTTPSKKLDVAGDINASGTITGGNIVAKYQDVAEWVETSQALPAGTVVILDSTKSNQVTSSTQAYDTRVAGVISEQPGIALGESGDNKVLVATTGRVRVKVDAGRGPIHIGDLLVTSDTSGAAMKSQPVNIGGVQLHRPGTLIGKALEPLAKGTGEILVLLSLQ